MINDEVYYVRVLYHTVKDRRFLDIRKWADKSTEYANNFVPTDVGIMLPANPGSFKLLEVALKQLEKQLKEK